MISTLALIGGGTTVALAIAIILLVRSLSAALADARASFASEILAGKAQIAAERNQLEAEKQRDAALAAQSKAEGDGKLAIERVAGLEATLAAANKRLAELQSKEIDNATGDDLVALSHSVLGPAVPATGAPGHAPAGDGAAQAPAVHDPGPASGR